MNSTQPPITPTSPTQSFNLYIILILLLQLILIFVIHLRHLCTPYRKYRLECPGLLDKVFYLILYLTGIFDKAERFEASQPTDDPADTSLVDEALAAISVSYQRPSVKLRVKSKSSTVIAIAVLDSAATHSLASRRLVDLLSAGTKLIRPTIVSAEVRSQIGFIFRSVSLELISTKRSSFTTGALDVLVDDFGNLGRNIAPPRELLQSVQTRYGVRLSNDTCASSDARQNTRVDLLIGQDLLQTWFLYSNQKHVLLDDCLTIYSTKFGWVAQGRYVGCQERMMWGSGRSVDIYERIELEDEVSTEEEGGAGNSLVSIQDMSSQSNLALEALVADLKMTVKKSIFLGLYCLPHLLLSLLFHSVLFLCVILLDAIPKTLLLLIRQILWFLLNYCSSLVLCYCQIVQIITNWSAKFTNLLTQMLQDLYHRWDRTIHFLPLPCYLRQSIPITEIPFAFKPTLQVIAHNRVNLNSKIVTILLDTGSTRSYITASLAKDLVCRRIAQPNRAYHLARSSTETVVHLDLILLKPRLCRSVTLLIRPESTFGSVQLIPDRIHNLMRKHYGISLDEFYAPSNLHPATTPYISIIIGADLLAQFLFTTQQSIKLSANLRLQQTVFGWTLQGANHQNGNRVLWNLAEIPKGPTVRSANWTYTGIIVGLICCLIIRVCIWGSKDIGPIKF